MIPDVTDARFAEEIFQSDRPTLTTFWAPWSRPSKQLEETLLAVAAEMPEPLRVLRLNVDENPVAALMYGVRSVPTVILFRGEEELGRFCGVPGRRELREKVRALLG